MCTSTWLSKACLWSEGFAAKLCPQARAEEEPFPRIAEAVIKVRLKGFIATQSYASSPLDAKPSETVTGLPIPAWLFYNSSCFKKLGHNPLRDVRSLLASQRVQMYANVFRPIRDFCGTSANCWINRSIIESWSNLQETWQTSNI